MKKLLILTLAILAAAGCKKDFGDLNVDSKRPSEVPPGTLFVYAQKSLVDQMTTPNVNSGIFRLLSQQWTETTYIDESNYDLATRNIPQNFWNTMFTGVLVNLNESKKTHSEPAARFGSHQGQPGGLHRNPQRVHLLGTGEHLR